MTEKMTLRQFFTMTKQKGIFSGKLQYNLRVYHKETNTYYFIQKIQIDDVKQRILLII